jgi:hypothetical protein
MNFERFNIELEAGAIYNILWIGSADGLSIETIVSQTGYELDLALYALWHLQANRLVCKKGDGKYICIKHNPEEIQAILGFIGALLGP